MKHKLVKINQDLYRYRSLDVIPCDYFRDKPSQYKVSFNSVTTKFKTLSLSKSFIDNQLDQQVLAKAIAFAATREK